MSDFTEQEFIKKYNEIKRIETALITPEQVPAAYILGGQPGAGKTGIQTEIIRQNSNICIINADSYRKHHPHFDRIQAQYGDSSPKYTQPFINAVTEKLIDDLSNEKYNLIIEGTLRTAEVPLSTARKLKEKGYRTELCVMAVKPEISYESTILRYENAIAFGEIPRATSKAHHDMVVERIAENLDTIYESGIFDRICIYTRDNGCIYSSDASTQKPSEIEKEVLFGEWSEYEKESIRSIIQQIIELKQKRGAEDLAEYQSRSEDLQNDPRITISSGKPKSTHVRISNLSLEQAAHLAAAGIPMHLKKSEDGTVTVFFEKDKLETVKATLSSMKDNKNDVSHKHKPKR